jgi:type VI secretion system protein ImpH
MASYGWGTDRPVEDWLFDEGYRFDFFQAVRLLAMRVPPFARGKIGPDNDGEVVRFRSSIEMAFPAADVARVTRGEHAGDAPEITVNLIGVAGALGPIPRPFAQLVYDRVRQGDKAMREFLDIFNHRLAMLLYQGREYRRIGFEVGPPRQQRAARYQASLIGMGTAGLQDRLPIPDDALLHFSGILGRRPTSMTGLETLLRGVFGLQVQGRSLQGSWTRLDESQELRLGITGDNQVLGQSAVLGQRVWDQQSEFELILGPLSWEQFKDLLPGGKGFKAVSATTRFVVGPLLRFKLTLRILAANLPAVPVSASGGARLGFNTWLSGRRPKVSSERRITIPSRLTSRSPSEVV